MLSILGQASYPELFTNTAAPLLAPLPATDALSVERIHWYTAPDKVSVANKGSTQSSRRFMNNSGYDGIVRLIRTIPDCPRLYTPER